MIKSHKLLAKIEIKAFGESWEGPALGMAFFR